LPTVKCFSCSTNLEVGLEISRREECHNCGADVRVCKNCRFYDPKSYNECRETQADVVKEKDRSNFCEFFEPGDGSGAGKDDKADLKAAAEALFKK